MPHQQPRLPGEGVHSEDSPEISPSPRLSLRRSLRRSETVIIDSDDDAVLCGGEFSVRLPRMKPGQISVQDMYERMDLTSKQVHRMADQLIAVRKQHGRRSTVRSRHRKDSFGPISGVDDSLGGDNEQGSCTLETAEESLLDDAGRCEMEDVFVKCCRPNPDDLRLLEMVGPSGETDLFMDYQRIAEYFRHKSALTDRRSSVSKMKDAANISGDDDTLKELSGWHGDVTTPKCVRHKSRKAMTERDHQHNQEENNPSTKRGSYPGKIDTVAVNKEIRSVNGHHLTSKPSEHTPLFRKKSNFCSNRSPQDSAGEECSSPTKPSEHTPLLGRKSGFCSNKSQQDSAGEECSSPMTTSGCASRDVGASQKLARIMKRRQYRFNSNASSSKPVQAPVAEAT